MKTWGNFYFNFRSNRRKFKKNMKSSNRNFLWMEKFQGFENNFRKNEENQKEKQMNLKSKVNNSINKSST